MKLVLNEAVAVARRRDRVASREVGGAEEILARLADPGAGPHGLAEAEEVRRRAWRALEELPPIQRAAIVQRCYLGLSEAEISERGESPPGTIKRPRCPPKARRRSGRNSVPRREATVADRSKQHLERVLHECAESGVPATAAPWPAIRERLGGQERDEARPGETRADEGRAAEAPRARRPLPVPDRPLGWALAILSVLIIGLGAYAASGPIRELFGSGPFGPGSPRPDNAVTGTPAKGRIERGGVGGPGADVTYAHNDERNTVSCGTGRDTVYFDRALDSLAADCERRIPRQFELPTNVPFDDS